MSNHYAERARDLRDLIEAEASKPENAATMSPVSVAALRDAGLFWLLVPETLGGSDASTVTFIEMVEELASTDAPTSSSSPKAATTSFTLGGGGTAGAPRNAPRHTTYRAGSTGQFSPKSSFDSMPTRTNVVRLVNSFSVRAPT